MTNVGSSAGQTVGFGESGPHDTRPLGCLCSGARLQRGTHRRDYVGGLCAPLRWSWGGLTAGTPAGAVGWNTFTHVRGLPVWRGLPHIMVAGPEAWPWEQQGLPSAVCCWSRSGRAGLSRESGDQSPAPHEELGGSALTVPQGSLSCPPFLDSVFPLSVTRGLAGVSTLDQY